MMVLITIGLVVGCGMVQTVRRRSAAARRFRALCAALATGRGEETLREIDGILTRSGEASARRMNAYPSWARLTLYAAARAAAAGHVAEALRWTDRIDPRFVGEAVGWLYAQNVATYRLALGDRAGARSAMAQVSRPAKPPSIDQALEALDALLEALDGLADAALARADAALTGSLDGVARMTWLATRAHALEASGAHHESRTQLQAIHSDKKMGGERLLKQIVGHRGPASTLAATLLVAPGPYR
jgi:hypothetical protein